MKRHTRNYAVLLGIPAVVLLTASCSSAARGKADTVTGQQRSQAALASKEALRQQTEQKYKDNGGKALLPPLPSPPLQTVTTPQYKVQPLDHTTLPNEAMMSPYVLSAYTYTDSYQWVVLAGNEKADTTTGIVMVFGGLPNFSMRVVRVPNAGQILITGCDKTIVKLKSDLGIGTYDTKTKRLAWGG